MDDIFNVHINVVSDVDFDLIKNIEEKIKDNVSLNSMEVSYFLNYLCYKVRCILCNYNNENIDSYDYKNMCNYSQAIFFNYFNCLGVKNSLVCTSKIFFNVVRHFFIIVFLLQDNEYVPYLIDPTYNQFFDINRCLDKNFVIKDGIIKSTPDPGYFVSMSTYDDKKMIVDFLKCGFHVLDNKFAKIYGDSFYKTQIGITKEEYDNLFVSSSSYIKFFLKIQNEVTKNYDELEKSGLLLSPFSNFRKKGLK